MVGLAILGIVATATLPLFINALRATALAKQETLAKNLATSRLDAMRNLPFHVAFQNGPYVDMLDSYYTSTSTTPVTIPATTGCGSAAVSCPSGTGVYVANGTGAGGTPTGPYYQVTFTQLPAATGFTEIVDTQFLVPNTNPSQAVTPPSTYNNEAVGTDNPPSLLVGVTVLTSWSSGTQSHSARVYTEIGATGHDAPLVLGQAGATALTISSTAYDSSLLTGTLAQVGLNANLSNESSAAAQAVGASFNRADQTGNPITSINGAAASVVAPSGSSSTAGPDSPTSGAQQTDSAEGTCGWGAFGPTDVTDASSSVANAEPQVPSDVETGTPAPTVTAGLEAQSGGACSGLSFTNVLAGGPGADPALGMSSSSAVVYVPNTDGAGNVVAAAGNVDTPSLSSGKPVAATATATFTQQVQLFTGTSYAGGHPLVEITLSNATISCVSTSQSATGSYALTLSYWSQTSPSVGGYVTTTVNWSAGQSAPTLPNPATITVGYNGTTAVPLSTFIQSWTLAGSIVQQSGGASGSDVGLHAIPEVLSVLTQPVLGSTYPDSSVSVGIGQLSCVTEDNR